MCKIGILRILTYSIVKFNTIPFSKGNSSKSKPTLETYPIHLPKYSTKYNEIPQLPLWFLACKLGKMFIFDPFFQTTNNGLDCSVNKYLCLVFLINKGIRFWFTMIRVLCLPQNFENSAKSTGEKSSFWTS